MLTGIVIAKNEQQNLKDCLLALKFCSHLVVVDNNSSDETAKIAKTMGAKVFTVDRSADFSFLRNFALKQVNTPWALFIDADERVSAKLAAEISQAILSNHENGFFIRREDIIWGKRLRYGDVSCVDLLRLGRTSAGKWSGKVHEVWNITGSIGRLTTPLDHYAHRDLAAFITSLNYYSGIRAAELVAENKKTNVFEIILYPLFKFIYLWVFKLGFLDGVAGLIHAMTMSFYSFLVRSKLYLLTRGITDTHLRLQ